MISRDEIEVFSGHMTANEAYLYVRVPGLGGGGSWQLSGSLRGPYSMQSHTLPLEVPLFDLGAGPSLLARAVMPDPCFWSLDTPALYRLSIDLRDNGEVAQNTTLEVGFRFLGAAGTHLRWESRRWVLRAVAVADATEATVQEAHQAPASLIVKQPGTQFCQQANRSGVLLVGDLRLVSAAKLIHEVRCLAHHPAVFMVVLPQTEIAEKDLRAASGNLLLAQYVENEPHARLAPWANVVVSEMRDPEDFAAACSGCPVPVIAFARDQDIRTIADARRHCDVLQRQLAPYGDFAGYAVEGPTPTNG